MKIEHNSQSQVYRDPFGAREAGSTVTLRISLVDAGIPEYVRIGTENEDNIQYFDMHYVFEAANVYFYEVNFTVMNYSKFGMQTIYDKDFIKIFKREKYRMGTYI